MTRKPRYVGPDAAALTAEQEAVAATIKSGPRGEVVGPLRVWLTNPGLAAHAQKLGQHARYDSLLSEYLSELAILVTGRYWSSGFEWAHHAPIAIRAGHSEAVVEEIAAARRPEFPDEAARVVFDFAVELHRDKRVSDETYAAAERVLGIETCVDLVGICGYYTLISMTINAFEVPDGEGPGLPVLDIPLAEYFHG